MTIGDLHCYQQSYERAAKGEIPDRLLEWEKVADALIDVVSAKKPDMVVFPGDIFINSRPEPVAMLRVLELFSRITSLGIKVIACAGNHDWLGPGKECAVDILGYWDPHWGITKPTIIAEDDMDIAIAVMPWQRQQDIDGTPDDMVRSLADMLATCAPDKPHVLMGHWTVRGASYCTGILSDEVSVSVEAVRDCGYKAVIMGHIHKPQVLSNNPLVLHTGTFTRAKIDEGKVPCGGYMIDIDNAHIAQRFFKLPARDILTLDMPEELMAAGDKDALLEEIGDISDAIVVPRCQLSSDAQPAINSQDLASLLQEAGAWHVAPMRVSVERKIRSRAAEVDGELSPLAAFKAWCKANDVDDDKTEQAATMLKQMLADLGV